MTNNSHIPADESAVTDIEITPDGCIYIFGASRRVLELLRDAGIQDPSLQQRLSSLEHSDDQLLHSHSPAELSTESAHESTST